MSDLKSEKISPTRPPMAYPKMQEKKFFGGDFWEIFLLSAGNSGNVRFCISMVSNDTNILFFYLKFNKMDIILKLSEKIFDLGLVGIFCIFSLNS